MTEYNVGRISKVLCNDAEVKKVGYQYYSIYDTPEREKQTEEMNLKVDAARKQIRVGERCYSLDPKYEKIYGTNLIT